MMLSPQAARMGCVSTSKGHLRRSTRFLSIGRRHFDPSLRSRFPLSKDLTRAFSSGLSRFKSTMAAYDEGEDDNIDFRHQGHVAAAEARASDAVKSHDEAWRINLGRDGDNEWLTGPRDQDWFTGVAPRECPGKYDDTLYSTRVLCGMLVGFIGGCLVRDGGMRLIVPFYLLFKKARIKRERSVPLRCPTSVR
jgi:hypothetical protein